MSMGWQCPGCGRCYSPAMLECSRCGNMLTITGVTSLGETLLTQPTPCAENEHEFEQGRCKKCKLFASLVPCVTHDFDFSSTVPHCKRCGQMQVFTFGSVVEWSAALHGDVHV